MLNRRHFFAAALVMLGGAAGGQGLGLTGQYQVDGRNPDGTRYEGVARIVQVNDRINMTWTVGGQVFEGRGVVEGTVMTIDWGADTPVVYDVSDPYRLLGVWAGGKASEVLTPIP